MAGADLRLIFGWTGIALIYVGAILIAVVGAWAFGRLARRDLRVAEAPGLITLATAVAGFGVGLAVISLDSPPLVPLGLGMIGLSLAIGTYGARLLRTRS